MRWVDEYRDPALVRSLSERIRVAATQKWTLMEVCGGQTHAFLRWGIDQLLPPNVELIHGPGCPVCVTPMATLDAAIELAQRPGVTLCTFGDMLRVPGRHTDLMGAKAAGGDVRIVYAPLDAVAIARAEPDRDVVFLAVGFETTAPANAMAVLAAARDELSNFSLLVSHVLVPPALEAILSSEDNRVQAFLAAGHVCTVMGVEAYQPIAERFGVPIVVTGFEPTDLLAGVLGCVEQLESGRAEVENTYERAVRSEGNPHAQDLVNRVFEVGTREWRGLGEIPSSGLHIRPEWAAFDASRRFGFDVAADAQTEDDAGPPCVAGTVLRGACTPAECPSFGTACTPENPIGAPMVSSEGACAAWYRYRRHDVLPRPR